MSEQDTAADAAVTVVDHRVPSVQTGTMAAKLANVGERVALLRGVRATIDHEVSVTCFDKFEEHGKVTVRRNHNYAKVIHAIVGGAYEYLKDAAGVPIFQRHDYTDKKGDYYVYECFTRYTIGDSVTEGTGTYSSRDKFLGKAHSEFKDVEDVEERSIRVGCATEGFKKVMFAALGYGDASEVEMERAGKNVADMKGHKFRPGTDGGAGKQTEEEGDLKGDCKRMCHALLAGGYAVGGEAPFETPEAVLKAITTARGKDGKPTGKWDGWRKFSAITEKSIKRTHSDIRKVYDGYTKAAPGGAPGADQDEPPYEG